MFSISSVIIGISCNVVVFIHSRRCVGRIIVICSNSYSKVVVIYVSFYIISSRSNLYAIILILV